MVAMIALKDVSFGYAGTERPALSRVNLEFQPGEFSLVCGATGSGKSTLLRILNGLAPHFTGGSLSGSLVIDGTDVTGSKPHELASVVGFVNQQPESSFVSDTVQQELVYGMEQLGFERRVMAEGIERVSKLLDIEDLIDRPLGWLSGGQQQRVAIAAALAAGQKILLLDEPTSALDPEAAAEIIGVLKLLAHQHGITVILVEHRIERVIELVDSVVIVANDGLVTKGGYEQFENYHLVPPVIGLSTLLSWEPVTVDVASAKAKWQQEPKGWRPLVNANLTQEVALEVTDLSVSYDGIAAVSEVSFKVHKGEVVALMGRNGSGKSSALWAIQGGGRRTSGSVNTEFGDPGSLSSAERLCLLTLVPQKAADLLFLNSLADELAESDKFAHVSDSGTSRIFESLTGRLDPKIHPRDLSAGQQLALVLALQLVKGAGILLLDEPTRGLDYAAKRSLAKQIRGLRKEGKAVLVASHDVEFVALVADRVLQLESGILVSNQLARSALGCGSAHPTQIGQITSEPGLLTLHQIEEGDK
jgi:energy-coupling factor transport system ATP-binding protein